MNTPITVRLAERSYPIHAWPGLLSEVPPLLATATPARSFLLVTHPRLLELYGGFVSDVREAGASVSVAVVPTGERSKSMRMAVRLYRAMAEARLDRHGAVLALGGGVIGDLAGFAAATWLRGVDVVQIPTTLLAMVDSAIGGKTGVNLPFGKNLVGAFHQPRAVLADPDTLSSLPARDMRSGVAEVIKYGVIADAGLFAYLEANVAGGLAREPEAITRFITDSARIKAEVVSADEREGGRRAILNYGHTAGHAIEKAAGYRRLRHGEAVALGMRAAARIGARMGITPDEDARRVEALITRAGLPERLPAGLNAEALMQTLAFDKKSKSGRVRWVMADRIGRALPGVDVCDALAVDVLRGLGAE